MKYVLKPTSRFQKDLKKLQKRNYNIDSLKEVLNLLANGELLSPKHRDHVLSGVYAGMRECHIEPDWLLIYEIKDEDLILYLMRTGTHSDLF